VKLDYRLLNVFTRDGRPLSGNPLCVFEDGTALDTAAMQALARQFNLSETTFLLPSAKAQARVRIFTPGYEMPFAGHPTLGSAQVCRSLGLGGDRLTLEMTAGLISVEAHGRRWRLRAPAPTWREVELPRARLAELLGLTSSDLIDRPLWVSAGKEQLIVPLASAAGVQRANPPPHAFRELVSRDGQGMACVFALEGDGRAVTRFFFPLGTAVLEDPANGSACANTGGWWLAMKRDLPCNLMIYQGDKIDRPSTLYLTVEADRSISVAGDVIELGRGAIEL